MDRLRGRFEEVLRELERLSQQEPTPPRPIAAPPRPVQARPRPAPRPDLEGQDAETLDREVAPPVSLAPQAAPVHALGAEMRVALGSRAALRQAFFLREILGPPRALQDPRDEGRGGL